MQVYTCPKCGSKVTYNKDRFRWMCEQCSWHISVEPVWLEKWKPPKKEVTGN